MCDFEAALLNGLKEIFPEADMTGCWFHFSQVLQYFHIFSCLFLWKARYTFGNANKKYFAKLLEAIENDAELGGDIQEEEDEEAAVQVQVQQQPTGGEDQEAQNGGQIQINRCVICMDRKPEVVLAPCGHQNICAPCANQWKEENGCCPTDRRPIEMIVSLIPL